MEIEAEIIRIVSTYLSDVRDEEVELNAEMPFMDAGLDSLDMLKVRHNRLLSRDILQCKHLRCLHPCIWDKSCFALGNLECLSYKSASIELFKGAYQMPDIWYASRFSLRTVDLISHCVPDGVS